MTRNHLFAQPMSLCILIVTLYDLHNDLDTFAMNCVPL